MRYNPDRVPSEPIPVNDAITPWPDDRLHCDTFPYLLIFHSDPRRTGIHVVSVLPVPNMGRHTELLANDLSEMFVDTGRPVCCLVMNGHLCTWYSGDVGGTVSAEPPRGGFVVDAAFGSHPFVRGFGSWANRTGGILPIGLVEAIPLPGEKFRYWSRITPQCSVTDEGRKKIRELGVAVLDDWHITRIAGMTAGNEALLEASRPLVESLGGISTVRIINVPDIVRLWKADRMGWWQSQALLMDRIVDLLETPGHLLHHAGLFQEIEPALSEYNTPIAWSRQALHTSVTRIVPEENLAAEWEAFADVHLPALLASPFNAVRLDLIVRVLEQSGNGPWDLPPGMPLPLLDEARVFIRAYREAYEAGAGSLFRHNDELLILPACRSMFDEDGAPHCENGAALSDHDGGQQFRIHGLLLDEQTVVDPLHITDRQINATSDALIRDVMIHRRAEARLAWMRAGNMPPATMIIPEGITMGGYTI